MFPLHSHTELTKWAPQDAPEGDKGTLARSIDGVTIKDTKTGRYFDADELPVKPGRYVSQKKSGYEYSKTILFVDKNFTNIYQLILKSFGLGECYDPLTKTTKFNTNYDPTCHKKWFNLTSKDVAHNFGTSYVFAAGLSEEDMSGDDVNTVMIFKEWAREYHEHQLKARDIDRENMAAKTANMEETFESDSVETETIDTTATDTATPKQNFDDF